MEQTVPIVLFPLHDAPAALRLSPAAADALAVRAGDTVSLYVPPRRLPVQVDIAPAQEPAHARLSSRVMAALPLPPGVPLQLRRRPGDHLEAGPFIGIMSHPRKPGNPYELQTTFFQRLLRYGDAHHLGVFIFSPPDVNWRNRSIFGWTYRPRRGWIRLPFPFPRAVYDRTLPNRSTVGAFHRFHRMGIPVFNSPVGSKWWQYQLLAKDPELRDVLPETRPIFSVHDLTRMMRRHGGLYIKSPHGGKGVDIWEVTPHRGRFLVKHNGRGGVMRAATVATLASLARTLALRSRHPYLAQARLQLMRWQDRIFDIRVLTQKDGTGTWRVTGIGLRVGRQGGIVSNLHGGGRTAPLEPVLSAVLRKRTPDDVREECEELALQVAQRIDGACARVGELGVDLALDTAERLWFLEANSRTGRNVVRSIGPEGAALAADVRPLHYATYLAGFTPPLEPLPTA